MEFLLYSEECVSFLSRRGGTVCLEQAFSQNTKGYVLCHPFQCASGNSFDKTSELYSCCQLILVIVFEPLARNVVFSHKMRSCWKCWPSFSKLQQKFTENVTLRSWHCKASAMASSQYVTETNK